MTNIFHNKKAMEKMLSAYWFVILIIVSGGIFAMVTVFYGHPSDIREIEANILLNKIADCLSQQGRINQDLLSQGNFNQDFKNNFLKKCTLNFAVEKNWDVPQYYIEINFYNISNLKKSVFTISEGNKNIKEDCKTKKEEENYQKLSKCIEKSIYALDENHNQHIIKILSVVNKAEKNVKQ